MKKTHSSGFLKNPRKPHKKERFKMKIRPGITHYTHYTLTTKLSNWARHTLAKAAQSIIDTVCRAESRCRWLPRKAVQLLAVVADYDNA